MNILITGGTGLIGIQLTKVLQDNGHQVRILSRKPKNNQFVWDLANRTIDPNAFKDLNAIVHLAGESVAQRWTPAKKKSILTSRVQSANLLFEYTKQYAPNLNCFVSASGINYYGTITQEKAFVESDPPANDFLGTVCAEWEQAAQQFEQLNSRVVILRTGIVLANNGGALKKMLAPAKLGLGSALGNGKQIMPWVHIKDLCNLYLQAVQNQTYQGAYNAVAPSAITNKHFTQTLNKVINQPNFAPNIPPFVLRLIYGKMATILLEGSPVSAKKVLDNGFEFKFNNLEAALIDLLRK